MTKTAKRVGPSHYFEALDGQLDIVDFIAEAKARDDGEQEAKARDDGEQEAKARDDGEQAAASIVPNFSGAVGKIRAAMELGETGLVTPAMLKEIDDIRDELAALVNPSRSVDPAA